MIRYIDKKASRSENYEGPVQDMVEEEPAVDDEISDDTENMRENGTSWTKNKQERSFQCPWMHNYKYCSQVIIGGLKC